MGFLGFDAHRYPFASRRTVVYARRGMVATSQPLAAQAGLHVLEQGGNAIDAAVATAAALTVVEPTSNGIGSDAFAIVWHKGKMYGLNSSGPSPMGMSIDALLDRGYDEMPTFGWMPVNVPGAPAAWAALVERFGTFTLAQDLDGAVSLASDGFPVSPVASYFWQRAFNRYAEVLKGPEYEPFFRVFTLDGEAPKAGQLFASPDHARTLQLIGMSGAREFYEGSLADAMHAYAVETGGLLRKSDFMAFRPEWVDPISVSYRNHDVWEIPPNGQGIVALMALGILNGFDLSNISPEERAHLQIEATKLAFEVGLAEIADPRSMRLTPQDMLAGPFLDSLRDRIGETAIQPNPSESHVGGTVYLCTADGDGNMVSYIQSNYMGFGSGIVVPGTGISLQNRGHNFSLNPNHPNALGPGKRPYHTIIPGFLTKDGQAVGPFGVMGGFMQPQGHVQVVSNTLDLHLNPQSALDAPRWQWMQDKRVVIESAIGDEMVSSLRARGHEVEVTEQGGPFGRGEIIWRQPDGVLVGGSEPRTDGTVAAF